MLFSSNVQILLSKNKVEYPEDKIIKLYFENEIGEGSYGMVYKLNKDCAIKIFKNCTLGHIDLSSNENELLPKNNENRELLFYFELLKKNMDIHKRSIQHILQPISIGIIKEPVQYILTHNNSSPKSVFIQSNSYFVILPLCTPFYKILPITNNKLIEISTNTVFPKEEITTIENTNKISFGTYFVLNIMKYLSIASIYLEDEFKIYNLDFKTNNIMFLKSTENNIDYKDLIVVDFGLIKHIHNVNPILTNQISNKNNIMENNNKIFNYDHLTQQKYFIWPYSGTALISQIPSYSICIIGLELLFGKKEVEKLPSYRLLRKIIDKLRLIDNSLYNLFYEGLITKITTKKLLSYIDIYIS